MALARRRWAMAAAGALALLVAGGLSACGGRANAANGDPAAYVDPFVGASNGGDTFPGADVPFGMVQWSPDTASSPGGYTYSSTTLRGFSLTHLSGAGCSGYGDVPFLPVTAVPSGDPSPTTVAFSHSQETADAGYYAVTLASGVRAQLTVTQRSGFGRFTYPAGSPAVMLIKAGTSANASTGASVSVVGNDEVVGSESSGNFCGAHNNYTVYFAAEFQRPFTGFGTWTPAGTSVGARQATGPGSGAYVVATPSTGGVVRMKVGVSFVSTANALDNLRTEDPGWTFSKVRGQATATWNRMLSAIAVSGGTTAEMRTFYTALYHALLQPNVFSDVNGQYIGFDGKVHTAQGYTQYANFSGWDIYRSEVQLLALLAPKQTGEMMQSLVADAAQGGWLPKWPMANGYTGVMNGDSADAILGDAYAFGARNFNAKAALAAMVHGATVVGAAPSGYVERPGLASYLHLGYVPGQAANTLEYNTDDFAIAQLAQALGDTSVYQQFLQRAQGWRFLVDPASGFLEPAASSGAFPTAFNPASQTGYREGDAYQYTWMVPFNVGGLAHSLGGASAVIPRLNSLFQQLNAGPDASHYWAGNEPGLEIPWEYDFLGDPAGTTAVVRSILSTLYTPTPGGLPGNDDLGAMSSWYVWAAMGMYPEIPAVPDLVLSAPLFPEVQIHLPDGRTYTIRAPGATPRDGYITAVQLNGQAYARTWLPLSAITRGGTVQFTLQPGTTAQSLYTTGLQGVLGGVPQTTWGTAASAAPPSFGGMGATVLPYLTPSTPLVLAGAQAALTVGLRNVSPQTLQVTWSATAPAGLTLSPAQGTFSTAADATGTVPVSLVAAGNLAPGVYSVVLHFQAGGQSWSKTTQALVAAPGSLAVDFNNTAISNDTAPSSADADGGGYSLSAQALAAVGVVPGGTIHAAGTTFTWPNVPAGMPDNVSAAGQTLPLPAQSGATVLSILGTGTNGPVAGTATIRYTDGTTQSFTLGMSDWTLNAGAGHLQYGDQIAVSMPYRNSASGAPDHTTTMLFTLSVPLQAGKVPQSLTLPVTGGAGRIHIFGLALH